MKWTRLILVGALAACSWRPGTVDVHLSAEETVALPAVATHVDLRTDEGRWVRIAVGRPGLPEGEAEVVLTRGMVPPGRYTAVRVGYYLAVPRPELQVALSSAEGAEDHLPSGPPRMPYDIVQREAWSSVPFCIRRGGDLRLRVAVDPTGTGRTPAFLVEGVPGC